MATQLQIRRGTSAQIAAFTGAEGEIVVNTTNDSVHVNDGSTAGGFEMARADLNNVSDTSLNAALTGNTVSALTVTALTAGGAETDAFNSSGTTLEIKTGARVRGAAGGDFQVSSGAANDSSEPTYTFRGDPDTGIFWGGANTVGVTTGGNQRINIASNGDISFYNSAGTSQSLFWDASAESLGIGTSSPKTEMNLSANNSGQGAVLTLENSDTGITTNDVIGQIDFYANDGSTNGTGAKVNIKAIASSGAGSNTSLTFGTSDSTSATAVEAMRIDASGNFLVGKTSADNTTAGTTIYGAVAPGAASFVRDAGNTLVLNRLTSDGEILAFRKDGTTVGSIGTYINFPYIGKSDVNLLFDPAGPHVIPRGTNGGARDGAINLGSSSNRFKDLYLSGRSRIDNNTNISMSGTGDGQLMISGNGYDGAIALDATGMHFYHNSSGRAIIFGTNEIERARFEASGHLNVGFTSFSSMGSNNTGGRLSADGTTNALARGSNGVVLYLYSGSGGAGNITVTGNTASYNETSDQRLKENIVEAPSSSDDIDAIQVRSFDWKADGRHQKYGMIAQELNTVAPDAVTIPEDPDEMAGVDYSKLVPMLVKEIQSLRARVAQLENN